MRKRNLKKGQRANFQAFRFFRPVLGQTAARAPKRRSLLTSKHLRPKFRPRRPPRPEEIGSDGSIRRPPNKQCHSRTAKVFSCPVGSLNLALMRLMALHPETIHPDYAAPLDAESADGTQKSTEICSIKLGIRRGTLDGSLRLPLCRLVNGSQRRL